ncbi:hypothetical protein J2Z83_003741 [Virgibacillus natechei]|uniref:Minor capsid protein n=1 Tax=Virgibacillus natechei TaxID=1216297 RepID=A0ABS4IKV6_9BACI|nr:phage minor capsid protein [Virgibacillus natechei]MBP1971590.1 hypothetical protein [Virgibacillus natechei]UZD13078.1 phage minor capsid protein [Virgibacillus natechei]
MDKRKLQNLSKPTVDVYNGIEEQLLINIAERIARHNSLLDGDIEAWQTQVLSELNSLSDDNVKFLASQTDKTKDEIVKMLDKAGYGSLTENEEILQEGVKAGRLDEPPKLRESSALAGILATYEAQATDKMNLVNSTLLDQSQQAYRDIVNRTTGQVLAGVSTGQEALRQTASEWAEQGVPALIDRGGRRWSTEAYVSAVTRSTSNNIANEMQLERMEEYGSDLIEISSHSGARKNCFPYQGKVFSRSGEHGNYPPLSSTSYGEPSGIAGVNCGHVFHVFIEGISERTYEQGDKKENDKVYEESQKQRYLERQIRHAKREERMMESLGDDEGVKAAHRKVLDRQKNQREFLKSSGRTRRYDREAIH